MSISLKIQQQMSQGSWVRRMFEEGIVLKQRYGEDKVFDLSLGNPIMEPPPEFRSELLKLAQDSPSGMHRYMPNAGYVETRAAVADELAKETGLGFTANEIVMTCGAGGGLNVVLKTLLDPGQGVIIFAPYFVEYVYYADNHGGTCTILATDEGFNPDLDGLEQSVTSSTRVVLINSPNNPTGVVYGAGLLEGLGRLLGKKEEEFGTEIFLVSDEPYRKLIYDGLEYPHVFPHHPRSLVVTSHSKDLALPGERIGYIAVNPDYEGRAELVDGLTFCNRTLGFVNAPALMQHIVSRLQGVSIDVGEYMRKRDFLYKTLIDMGYSMVKPQGAFYMFPKSPIEDDVAFVRELQTHNVLVVPGSGFGAPGYFRISYCVDDRTIKGSLEGFRAGARQFGLSR